MSCVSGQERRRAGGHDAAAVFRAVRTALMIAAVWLAMGLCAPAVGAADDGMLKRATFIPCWVPHAQFAGYYMALHKGIYRKHGIDLTIIPGGPERPSQTLLTQGKADFGILGLSIAISMRDRGVRVINLAQMLQRSPLLLVAKKYSGIRMPRDLDGKKVGLWGGVINQVQPQAFFRKYRIAPIPIRQSYTINLFLRDGVAAASAMWYNEYHTILMSGLDPDELTTFFFNRYGLDFPEDGIYALEETCRRNPALCRAFVRASLEGWRYAFSHPDETLDVIMDNLRRARIPASRVHQKWMLDRIGDLMVPKDAGSARGMLREKDYRQVSRILLDRGLIGKTTAFGDFFRPWTGRNP